MLKNKPGPPKNSGDFSSNWKKLQATLETTETKKRKAENPQHKHEYKRRRLEENAEGFGKHAAKFANGLPGGKKLDVTGNQPKEEKNEIWFDDVDEMLLERPAVSQKQNQDPLLMQNAVTYATKALAMDCEMVGVGKDGTESILARVSIVNQHGHPIYDKFVKPREKVTDFRTHVSGVRPYNLRNAEDFLVVQKEVSDMLKERILVGHALKNDLKVLFLDHPRGQTRDTAMYKPFRQLFGGRTPSLKKLTNKLIGVSVQQGEHDSIQDAQAAMRLYMMHRKKWENELAALHKGKKFKNKKNMVLSKKQKKTKAVTKKVTFAADVNE